MKTPQFLRRLLTSPAYMDKNSKVYAMAEKYLNLLYPGMLQTDATGRMTEPEYDMTLGQFRKAQDELDDALEEAKQEAEAEYEEAGRQIDVEDNVELEETIDVRVLMPDGRIENKQLEVYTLNLPMVMMICQTINHGAYGVGIVKMAITPVPRVHRAMAKYMKAKMTSQKSRCIPTVDAV